ncbi:glutamate receptor ionotropic, delta-2-like [Penaeus vannamei]|uniref:glutamate receptor ionotropic, delta-2-like n=1 Tax=Penaeus vannamei TaxID=6689 RepID=UPI00387F4479
MADLLQIFSQMLKFDYELVRPLDRVWGTPDANGSWSGLIGMLQREEVEFALGPFGVSPQRDAVCDFSEAVNTDSLNLIMVRPTLESDMSGFVKPFSVEVWLLILLTMICTGTAMICMVWAEDRIFNSRTEDFLSKASMWVIKALTQEGSEWMPMGDGGRLLVTTWLLASLVFMSSYSGILTAMLTVPRVTIPIDSLADLVAQDDLPWRLETGSMMFQYFKEATDDVRKKVFDDLSGTFPDCWQAREAIAGGEYAAVCDKTTIKKAMSWDFSTTGRCHLYIAREPVYSNVFVAMAFRSSSSYLPRVNRVVQLMKESGILPKWVDEQTSNTSQCLLPPSSDVTNSIEALNMEDLAGPFLILVAGLIVSSIIFLFESAPCWSRSGNSEQP